MVSLTDLFAAFADTLKNRYLALAEQSMPRTAPTYQHPNESENTVPITDAPVDTYEPSMTATDQEAPASDQEIPAEDHAEAFVEITISQLTCGEWGLNVVGCMGDNR